MECQAIKQGSKSAVAEMGGVPEPGLLGPAPQPAPLPQSCPSVSLRHFLHVLSLCISKNVCAPHRHPHTRRHLPTCSLKHYS